MSLSLQTNLIWGKGQQVVKAVLGCSSTIEEDATDSMAGFYRRDLRVPLSTDKNEMG